MKVNVKILQGAECNVDIIPADSVDHLKHLVQVRVVLLPPPLPAFRVGVGAPLEISSERVKIQNNILF